MNFIPKFVCPNCGIEKETIGTGKCFECEHSRSQIYYLTLEIISFTDSGKKVPKNRILVKDQILQTMYKIHILGDEFFRIAFHIRGFFGKTKSSTFDFKNNVTHKFFELSKHYDTIKYQIKSIENDTDYFKNLSIKIDRKDYLTKLIDEKHEIEGQLLRSQDSSEDSWNRDRDNAWPCYLLAQDYCKELKSLLLNLPEGFKIPEYKGKYGNDNTIYQNPIEAMTFAPMEESNSIFEYWNYVNDVIFIATENGYEFIKKFKKMYPVNEGSGFQPHPAIKRGFVPVSSLKKLAEEIPCDPDTVKGKLEKNDPLWRGAIKEINGRWYFKRADKDRLKTNLQPKGRKNKRFPSSR